jgi:hypothetical protein
VQQLVFGFIDILVTKQAIRIKEVRLKLFSLD